MNATEIKNIILGVIAGVGGFLSQMLGGWDNFWGWLEDLLIIK